MKKIFLKFLFVSSLLLVIEHVQAQQGPPDPPGNPAGGGNEVVGGTAPVGNGISFLLALGLIYGTRKFYKTFKKIPIED